MLAILAPLLISLAAFPCTEPGKGFLPKNNLKIPVNYKFAGLTKEQYDQSIDRVLKIYGPVVKKLDAELIMDRKWEDETVNAGTFRDESGKHWHINLYGGFARHPLITQDGYTLVICHELGHHIGGAPKKVFSQGVIWSSAEGQADYFATLKCLRKVFVKDDNAQIVKEMEIPESVRTECKKSFPKENDNALCLRTSMAGLSVARVNADGRDIPPPDLEMIDPNVVGTTNTAHPEPQCRLNTYFQGAICPIPAYTNVSQTDEVKATCHPKSGYDRGLRPSCWYKP